jgi:integrase
LKLSRYFEQQARMKYPANGITETRCACIEAYVFRGARSAVRPYGHRSHGRTGGEIANLPFPVHVHMLRHSTGYALPAKGMDTRRLQHFLGHASITNTVRCTAMLGTVQGRVALEHAAFAQRTPLMRRLVAVSAGCQLGCAKLVGPWPA